MQRQGKTQHGEKKPASEPGSGITQIFGMRGQGF